MRKKIVSKRRAWWTLALLVIVVVAWLVISKLNQPAKGTVSYAPVQPEQTTASFNAKPVKVMGQYATFSYPAGLKVAKNNPINPPLVEEFNYSYQDVETWNLSIGITKNSGGVSNDSAYQFRKTKPDIYKESTQVVNNQNVVIMTDTGAGGFSKIAFLAGNGLSATVSLYGDDAAGLGNLTKTFNMVLGSWRWQ